MPPILRTGRAAMWASMVLLTTVSLPPSVIAQSKSDETLCRGSQPASAIPACDRLIEHGASGGSLFSAYLHRGNARFLNRENEKAIADYTEAIKRFPYLASYLNRAAVYLKIGEYDRAIADYSHVISEVDRPEDAAPAYAGRGQVLETQGNIELAIADFKKALELNPSEPIASAGLKRLTP